VTGGQRSHEDGETILERLLCMTGYGPWDDRWRQCSAESRSGCCWEGDRLTLVRSLRFRAPAVRGCHVPGLKALQFYESLPEGGDEETGGQALSKKEESLMEVSGVEVTMNAGEEGKKKEESSRFNKVTEEVDRKRKENMEKNVTRGGEVMEGPQEGLGTSVNKQLKNNYAKSHFAEERLK